MKQSKLLILNKPKATLFLFLLFLASLTSLAQPKEVPEPHTQFPVVAAFANSKINFKIIDAVNKTFGYDILADERLLIHQPSVPGMPGNEGFKTSQSAQKVAELVIKKITKGEMPPTISKEEMQKLNAIN
jgi:hypothetical protein